MHTIITYFSDPIWWDIADIHSWALAALAYGIVALLIARYCGTKRAHTHEGTPTTGVPHPHSPAHYYEGMVGTKHTHVDIDMDDPAWVAMLDDALDEG